MQIVFMGTPDFAVPTLEALQKAGHEVVLVLTQPDRPSGRGKKLRFSPVKTSALELGIPVWQPEKLSDLVDKLTSEFRPQAVVVVAYGQILPEKILKWPVLGCINVHASLLPAYRGAAPIQRAVMEGQKETGVTTMLMNEGLDSGDILLQKALPVKPEDTAGSVHDRLAEMGAELLLDTLQKLEQGQIVPWPQEESKSCYAAKLTSQDELIDWKRPAEEIFNQIRGLNSWPGAKTFWRGKVLKIWQSEPVEELGCSQAEPGTILDCAKNDLLIATGTCPLRIRELQLQGGKRLAIADFLRGKELVVGSCFGGKAES